MDRAAVDIEDGVATIVIDTAPDGYMNEAILADVARAFYRLERDDAVRVVVITGALPGVFIQHFDLRNVETLAAALNERGASWTDYYVRERPWDGLFRRMETSRLPVIAAINGNARGIGLELSLACDLRLMQDGDFGIGLPEVWIGTLPGAGGTQRLPRIIGQARALELILFGRSLSPAEAKEWGLVGEVTTGPVLERARAIARRLAAVPAFSVAYSKRLVRAAADLPLYQGLDLERSLFMDALAHPEALSRIAGVNARGHDLRHVEPL